MKELKFLLAVWKANLLSAMEYRVAFLSQAIGMMVNDFMYFVIWIIFFDRFQDVRGWGLSDMYLTYGVLASAFGLVSLLFGNAFNLSDIISKGRLDYYLSLPRPVLLHAVASRMIASGMGDFTYGFISYGLSGYFTWDGLLRFVLATLLAATVFAAFLILIQSLAFWLGIMSNLSALALNAMLTFGIYPITLFDNYAKLILFTLIPAALMGAVPAEFIRRFTWQTLAELLVGAIVFLLVAILVFRRGLRRYESGSAIQIEVQVSLKDDLRTELIETRKAFDELPAKIPEESLSRPSDTPTWTSGKVLFPMSLAPRFIVTDLRVIISHPWPAKVFAVIAPGSRFHRLNEFFTRYGWRHLSQAFLAEQYEQAHTGTELNGIAAGQYFEKSLRYPGYGPMLSGMVTVERLYRYIKLHFDVHAAQIRKSLDGILV